MGRYESVQKQAYLGRFVRSHPTRLSRDTIKPIWAICWTASVWPR